METAALAYTAVKVRVSPPLFHGTQAHSHGSLYGDVSSCGTDQKTECKAVRRDFWGLGRGVVSPTQDQYAAQHVVRVEGD